MRPWLIAPFTALCSWIGIAEFSVAQVDENEDFPSGLHAVYEAEGRQVERIDPDIAFDWGTAAADPRLPAGPFTATWTGQLLIRERGRYKIHVYLQGDINVTLDGKPVASGRRNKTGWLTSNHINLTFGEKQLRVIYERGPASAGQVAVFWSAEHFPIEPVPAHLLFHDHPRPDLNNVEKGRLAWESHRCNRCHQRTHEIQSSPAPSLTAIRDSLNLEWLVQIIRSPSTVSVHARMPSFRFSDDEARAVAAFLISKSEAPILEHPIQPQNPDDERASGRLLLHSVGCLACHTIGQLGTRAPFGGGDLSKIGRKRTTDWLYTWLADSSHLNRDRQMPTLSLSPAERHQLALALSVLQDGSNFKASSDAPKSTDLQNPVLIARGSELVRQSRCTACHRINGANADLTGLPRLSSQNIDWEKSCIAETAKTQRNQPFYKSVNLSHMRSFIESRFGKLSLLNQTDRGRHVLEHRGCLGCHKRNRNEGIASIAARIAGSVKGLNGESQALVPPALTAVGDKLIDSALAEAVRGEQKTRRLPWLHVRMPRYRHSRDDEKSLLQHLITHDRIPTDKRLGNKRIKVAASDEKNEVLLAGHTLVGAHGLSCIACHKIGRYEPRQVPLGTRGSDLRALDTRMRPEYYLRWTKSPLRIVPGMEMPSYRKAVPGILNENIDTQLTAIWKALNDPRFTAPTDPASVEQFFTISPGDSARIIRDVFTNREANGAGYTARAFATGMNNGHNVLFDLDTVSLRDWTFGDMARQRTQGKSWYWDMGGVPVMAGFDSQSDILLRQRGEPRAKPIAPQFQHGTSSRLVNYRNTGSGAELSYEVMFDTDSNKQIRVPVTEVIGPLGPTDDVSGWERSLKLRHVPTNFDILIEKPRPGSNSVGRPQIESPNATEQVSVSWTGDPAGQRDYFVWTGAGDSPVRARIQYLTRLRRHATHLKTIPPPSKKAELVTTVPGFSGIRLPIDSSIMPTAMTWNSDGLLAFTSLKGHVFIAHDTDGDGLEDKLTVFEEGLAAPYGIIADGSDLIVSHKPELIRLSDTDGDGRADTRTTVASGWGYTDNYHDWTCGIVRDSGGSLYVGLGSDYNQKNRPREGSRWRGSVLRVKPGGSIEVVGRSFRYPTGMAIDSHDRIFISDNQGVQNTFNEVNLLQNGGDYGVPSRYEENPGVTALWPAVQIPHPWSRSVNGLLILHNTKTEPQLLNHGIGCEYDSRFLIRFSVQQVGNSVQGACYYFSHPHQSAGGHNFVGPLCGAVAPNGDIYIGSIHDSGWLGGLNTGAITRLRRTGHMPNGIRELRATHDGFEIEFLHPINPQAAGNPERYVISGYTRKWSGNYATPDNGRHRVEIKNISVSEDARHVRLTVDRLEAQHVYDVSCSHLATDDQPLWPATGHYTMTRIPKP